jgi:membrane protease YdiL (CAAX protease family)
MAAALAIYSAAVALAAGSSLALGRNPLHCTPWLEMTGAAAVLSSLGLGLCLGAGTIAMTPMIVRRTTWARALHLALRPAVHGIAGEMLLGLAIASALAEELLFRGLLVPWLGILIPSIAFGALHQVPGPARWSWMAWATVMGVLFAVVFRATGNLAGPIVAHAAINAANLRYLRDNDPSPPRRPLGGLLRRG